MSWILVLVLIHPGGNSGLTSQQVSGYNSENSCLIQANVALKQKSVAAAFCLSKELRG